MHLCSPLEPRAGLRAPPLRLHAALAGRRRHTCSSQLRRRRDGAAGTPNAAARQRRRATPDVPSGVGGVEAEWEERHPPDWSMSEPESSMDELDLFPEPSGDPEYLLQDMLALTLISLLGLAVGNVLIKLAFVTYALVAAAFRYTVVGVLLLVLLIIFV